METIFSFLFKYRPLLFREGAVVFRTTWPLLLLLGVVALAVGLVVTVVVSHLAADKRD